MGRRKSPVDEMIKRPSAPTKGGTKGRVERLIETVPVKPKRKLIKTTS